MPTETSTPERSMKPSERAMPPSEQLAKFITRTWEHPLLDTQTKEHRSLAQKKLAILLNDFGLPDQDFITIPVGSLIWATDDQSDFDYQLIWTSQEASYRFRKICDAQAQEIDDRLQKEDIAILPNYPMTMDIYLRSDAHLVSLLFTPDVYLAGNIEVAQQIRLRYANSMKPYFEEPERLNSSWERMIHERWERNFRSWDDLSLESTNPKYREKWSKDDPARERDVRIANQLQKRAEQTHNPEQYQKAFVAARAALEFIPPREYCEAIIANNGALPLSEKYIAQGIKDTSSKL